MEGRTAPCERASQALVALIHFPAQPEVPCVTLGQSLGLCNAGEPHVAAWQGCSAGQCIPPCRAQLSLGAVGRALDRVKGAQRPLAWLCEHKADGSRPQVPLAQCPVSESGQRQRLQGKV